MPGQQCTVTSSRSKVIKTSVLYVKKSVKQLNMFFSAKTLAQKHFNCYWYKTSEKN